MAAPMMLPMAIPGSMMMDNNQPLALHLLHHGENQFKQVIELAPKGEAAGYIQNMLGAGATLPEQTDGFYKLNNRQAVRISGKRLLIAPNAGNADQWFGGTLGTLPAMPDIPGGIRIALNPAILEPFLQQAKEAIGAGGMGMMAIPIDNQLLLQKTLDFYAGILNQIDGIYLGLDVQEEGLYLRYSFIAKEGSDLAALSDSMQPAGPRQLAFIDDQALMSYASGAGKLPPQLEKQINEISHSMARLKAAEASVPLDDVVALYSQLEQLRTTPLGFTIAATPEGALQVSSLLGITNATAFLERQLKLQQSLAFQKLTRLNLGKPVESIVNGTTIHSISHGIDVESVTEELTRRTEERHGPIPPEQAHQFLRQGVQFAERYLGKKFDVAATAQGVAFGLGSDEVVRGAIAKAGAAGVASPAAMRLKQQLHPAQPHALGQISLSGIAALISGSEVGKPATPAKGGGLFFATWNLGPEVQGIIHLPQAEINAVRQLIESLGGDAGDDDDDGDDGDDE